MTTLEPVSVALKFGFLAVLYLFLLWVARSALKDLRGAGPAAPGAIPADATGLYSASRIASADVAHRAPRLVVERAPGHDPGMIYDLDGDIVLGRGERAEIRLEDPFASSRHARVYEQGNIVAIEDLQLHQRHLPQRGAAAERPSTASGGPRAHRRQRIHIRGGLSQMLRVAEQYTGTDTGRQRRANEDSMLARPPLFVVADGMGGAQAGEVASRLAVESFQDGLPDTADAEGSLAAYARAANVSIHELSRANAEHAGMGTTLTAVYVGAEEVAIAHVGDSRAYCLRGGALLRLTDDHSLVDELIRQGKLTARGGRRASPALGHHACPWARAGGRDRHSLLPRS